MDKWVERETEICYTGSSYSSSKPDSPWRFCCKLYLLFSINNPEEISDKWEKKLKLVKLGPYFTEMKKQKPSSFKINLNPSIKDSELNIPGYTLVRHDQDGKRGGVMAIYVRNNIPYKHRPDLSAENIESSWVEVNRLKCKKLFVGCAYRPPNACSDTFKFIALLNNSLLKLPTGSQIVLLGDFNIDFLAKKKMPHLN